MNNIYIDINEIGIDEAGRGSLLGRVYAGAVIWNQNIKECNLINDSKKLTSKKRKIALEWIKNNVTAWGVGYADENEIDKINILEATKLAINRAIEALLTNFNLKWFILLCSITILPTTLKLYCKRAMFQNIFFEKNI